MATPDTGVSSDVEVVENQPAVTSESGPDAAVASANEEFKHLGDTRLLCFDAPSVACAGVCCVGCGILSNALDTGTKLLPLGIPSLSAPCHFSVAGYSANALFSWLTLGVGALGACYCCVGSCVVLSLDGMICPKAVGEKVNDNVETKLAEMEVKVLGKTSQQVRSNVADFISCFHFVLYINKLSLHLRRNSIRPQYGQDYNSLI